MQIHQALNTTILPKDPNLYGIVHELIEGAAPLVVHNRNYIVNNIPADLQLETNGTIVSDVLNKLFITIVRHAQNSVILISAKIYGMTVLVQIRSKGFISPVLQEDMNHVCTKAQKTGGIIEMIQCESEQASIAYCFLNVSGAA